MYIRILINIPICIYFYLKHRCAEAFFENPNKPNLEQPKYDSQEILKVNATYKKEIRVTRSQ